MPNTNFLSSFIKDNGFTSIKNGDVLNDSLINQARVCLAMDCDAFFINALISFASCINSIKKNNYSWAFIQSYYALFYIAKSKLASFDIAVHYCEKKAFKIKLSRGEIFKKVDGNSHEIILKLYKEQFATDPFLCGEIAGNNVIDWFNKKREDINYKLSPMTDPEPPFPLFKYNNNLREFLVNYGRSDESSYNYSLSEEHAYIAFIYALISKEIDSLNVSTHKNKYITTDFIKHLKNNFCDNKGEFSWLIERIESLG